MVAIPPPEFTITDADRFGVPTIAVCSLCGDTWYRPEHDRNADTLPVYALDHRDAHRRDNGEQLRFT